MLMRWIPAAVLTAAMASTLACSSTEDMTLLHREITDVQREVQQLESSMPAKEDMAALKQQLQDFTTQTTRSNADLAMQLANLQEQMEALHASLELTTRRLQVISQELAAARTHSASGAVLPPVTAAEPTTRSGASAPAGSGQSGGPVGAQPITVPISADTTPEELYRSAYEDYMRGNYDLAAQGFREYLKRWTDTELADNALYWIGECLDAQEKTDEALKLFSQVLEDHPASDKAAAAQLKKGLLYLKAGDKGQGVLNLQYVVYEYPGTSEADLARERLRSLGMTIR
jgi:tol-pal system protein YbgF